MPVFLVLLLVAVLFISIFSSYHQGNDKRKIKEFLDEQNKTYVKPKEILNELPYVKVDFNDVKFKAKSSDVISEVNKLKAFQDEKLCNFHGMTNQELKKEYGSNNFQDVLDYQNNYEEYLKQTRVTAESLINDNDDKSAIMILNKAIELGDDVSKSYEMLADLYIKNNMRKEMYKLVDLIKQNKNLSQQKIMSYISKLERSKQKGEK